VTAPPTRRGAAVLGSPIAHSLSPVLHQAAYAALGLTDWHYRAVECTEGELAATLRRLDEEGLAGASLTMPLKRAVMALLTYGGDSAVSIGAANTVLFSDTEGQWLGTNTDVPGMIAALEPVLGADGAGQTACVLGAGATAAAAVAAAAQLGFARVEVFARRPASAAHVTEIATALGLIIEVRSWEELPSAARAPLVVATTPPDAARSLADAVQPGAGVLFDVIYSPWPTPLAQAWDEVRGRVVGGLELLVEQAALQVELMTGEVAPVAEMRKAGHAALRPLM
jgi:shikimate dehydrogenase